MSSVMPKHRPKTLQFDLSAVITRLMWAGAADRQRTTLFRFQGQKPFCVLLTQRASPLQTDSAHFREPLAHTRGSSVVAQNC